MAKQELKPVAKMKYEEAFAELETIVAALESGEHPLDESMTMFERGQGLVKRCALLLDQAELKVQQLSGDALVEYEEDA